MLFNLRATQFALIAALGCALCGPAVAVEFTQVCAPDSVTCNFIPNVTSLPGDGTKKVVYSAPISYASGDFLQMAGEFEVTNGTSSPAHVWAQIVLGSSATDTTGTALGKINEKILRSVSTGHHGVRAKGAITQLGATGSGYVNLVAWTDQPLAVEGENGELQGMLIVPPTGSGVTTFSVYDSDDNGGELLTSLPGDNTFRKLYSVDVSDLAANDILIVFSEAQLQASSVSGKQRLTTHLLRADPTTDGLSGTSLDAPNALNVASTSLIATPVKLAIGQVASGTSSTSRTQVNFLVQATTDLTITADTGRVQVLKIRPAS